ncbi:hypothetical protein WJX79_004379 [Trebouxia sp. C0005]
MASIRQSSVQGLVTVQTAAYNDNGTRLATCSADGTIHVCDRCEDQEHWQLTSRLPTEISLRMVKVAWAHSEHGSVIACASADGLVTIWQQAWVAQQVASEDGFVRLYEASSLLNADRWQLCNDFQASSSGPCNCISWRQHTPGLPPMLGVGTAQGAHVWFYRSTLGGWVKAAALDTHNEAVTAIDWAPAIGRPVELIATASTAGTCVWSLKGKVNNLQVHQMPCLSSDGQTSSGCLPVDGQVWKVEFDSMGSLLATSASDGDDSNVCIWALNPEGQWYLLSKIVGEPHEIEDNSSMLE